MVHDIGEQGSSRLHDLTHPVHTGEKICTITFLTIPAEIRIMVYGILLKSAKRLRPRTNVLENVYPEAKIDTTILRINHQIYYEAMDVFSAANVAILTGDLPRRSKVCHCIKVHTCAGASHHTHEGQVSRDGFSTEKRFRLNMNTSLLARLSNVHIETNCLQSRGWREIFEWHSGTHWYDRTTVVLLKAAITDIATTLVKQEPDQRKTLTISIPYVVQIKPCIVTADDIDIFKLHPLISNQNS